jgi:hypothetical protein
MKYYTCFPFFLKKSRNLLWKSGGKERFFYLCVCNTLSLFIFPVSGISALSAEAAVLARFGENRIDPEILSHIKRISPAAACRYDASAAAATFSRTISPISSVGVLWVTIALVKR